MYKETDCFSLWKHKSVQAKCVIVELHIYVHYQRSKVVLREMEPVL